jgi:hypothetical protein
MTSQEHPYMRFHHQSLMQVLTLSNRGNHITKRNEKLRPYLRQLGIDKEDKVITLPDYTPNASLFLMGQKGWSDFYRITSHEHMNERIDKGAKYLIVADKQVLEKEFLKPFLSNQIGYYDGITIFKLSGDM